VKVVALSENERKVLRNKEMQILSYTLTENQQIFRKTKMARTGWCAHPRIPQVWRELMHGVGMYVRRHCYLLWWFAWLLSGPEQLKSGENLFKEFNSLTVCSRMGK